MTNLERWQLYNRDLFSPDHYVDWGWYSLIGACLERRVMLGGEVNPIFPNMFVVFVAPAGVGKGQVADKVKEFLMHHRTVRLKTDTQLAVEAAMRGHPDAVEYMFPMAPDSTTYESLVKELADMGVKGLTKRADGRPYLHASMAFVLDEYTSVFKQHADDLITFLLTAWNGKDYQRKTKGKGHDWIKNPCLNLLSCTTPTEFAKILRKEIVGSGLLARTILVYEDANRSRGLFMPDPDAEQIVARDHLLEYIKRLKQIVTVVKFSAEARDFLTDWYKDPNKVRINTHPKLDEYYVRKGTHVQKLATIIHFSEPGWEGGTEIQVPAVSRAIRFLEKTEFNMHLPMVAGGRNELHGIAQHIVGYINRHPGGLTYQDLLIQFIADVSAEELQSILMSLRQQRQVLAEDVVGGVKYKPYKFNE